MQNGTLLAPDIAKLFNCPRDNVLSYLAEAGIRPLHTMKYGRGQMRFYDAAAVRDNSTRIAQIIQDRQEALTKTRREHALKIQKLASIARKERAAAKVAKKNAGVEWIKGVDAKLNAICSALGIKA